MKRVAIFAHYDNKNVIQDYVIYYLKELKKVVDKIVFVSDSDVQNKEVEKINDFIDFTIIGRHGEYDFGSYKRGFQCAKENRLLENCEELIFVNDSCYAPLFPFENMFSKMSPKDLDFWGATANPNGIEVKDDKVSENNVEHVQSYFVVFKPQVFKSECFDKFITSVKKENTKEEVIAYYEVGMSELLANNGFKYDVYCPLSKKIEGAHLKIYDVLITQNKSPFIKRSILLYKNRKLAYPVFARELIRFYTNYDYKLIETDKKTNEIKLNKIKHIKLALKAVKHLIFSIRKKDKSLRILGYWHCYK